MKNDDTHSPVRWLRSAASVLSACLLLTLGACTTIQNARGGPGQRLDPWENWNRKVFAFNEDLDRLVLKPVATGYTKVVPELVRRGVDNVFANVADAWSAVNNVLQAKPTPAFEDVVRVGTNTVFGIFGIFDIASEFGLEHHYEDFGQTLGRWGVGPGAYMVLPLLGPSTVRETAALPLNRYASPAVLINDGRWEVSLFALQLVNTRANLLGASRVIDDIALDKYSFVRDAYLQRRRSLVYDGNEPDLPDPNGPGDAVPVGGTGPGSAAAPASAPPKK